MKLTGLSSACPPGLAVIAADDERVPVAVDESAHAATHSQVEDGKSKLQKLDPVGRGATLHPKATLAVLSP